MKKIVIATVTIVALASFAGCMGKGKGKGKAPMAEPMAQEQTFVTKG